MKTNEFLGAIVAGCLMVIAFAIATNPEIRGEIHTRALPLPLPENEVVYTPVKMSLPLPENEAVYTPVEVVPVREVVEVDERQLECMTLNMYFEARNQKTTEAMAAVGYTVLNRVASPRYPNTICGVVYQGQRDSNGNYIRNRCQFSWVCDGKADVPNTRHPGEAKAWKKANEVALQVLTGTIDNPVGNATMYHATYVNPRWAKAYSMVAQIEDHIFYEKPSKNG